MSYSVFETGYAKNNQETLRWASVALAGFMVVLALIFAAWLWGKDRYQREKMTADAAANLAAGGAVAQSMFPPALVVAMYFLVTVASTFLSWYVASLHMGKNNLIALDVMNFIVILFLAFAAYYHYRDNAARADPNDVTPKGFLHMALVVELVVLILLMLSPQTAGSAGLLVQSTLYIPLIVASFGFVVMLK